MASSTEPPGPEKKTYSAAEIGRDWGTSRAYASQCLKKGCPSHSLEAAREWRVANSKYGVGYRSKSAPAVEAVPAPAPAPVAASVTSPHVAVTRDLSTVDDSLRAAIEVEQEAHRLVVEAQRERNDALLAVRIQSYNKARDGRMAAEKMVQEHLEKQGVLIRMDKAREIALKGWIPLLSRLRSVPKRAGIKANPVDDVHAEMVISEEIEDAIAEVRFVYG